MTEYIVMAQSSDGTLLEFKGTVEASSPAAACRALGDTGGDLRPYVAVPKRNWSQVMVGQEVQEPRVVAREVEPTFPDVVPGQTTIDEATTADTETAAL